MTLQRAAELLPIIKAFSDGKKIQIQTASNHWLDIHNPEFTDHATYRIAPEPKLKPWKPEEFPVGALLRVKNGTDLVSSILAKSSIAITYCAGNTGIRHLSANDSSYEKLVSNLEHSTDGGKTWLPCGVMEGDQ